MIQDKELLLKDLCARLPYGVVVNVKGFDYDYNDKLTQIYKGVGCSIQVTTNMPYDIEQVKPYLFPLSSMTEEQKKELYKLGWYVEGDKIYSTFRNYDEVNYKTHTDCFELINWCYKNNFDINGLIPMGLAIDATGLNVY